MNFKNRIRKALALLATLALTVNLLPSAVADGANLEVIGRVYFFDEDNRYEISSAEESEASDQTDTYGVFSVNGIISDVSIRNGVPAFTVSEGSLAIRYSYTDALLNAGEDEWHLVDDKNQVLDSRTLDEYILKGAIIIQTSKDRVNWVDVGHICNAFAQNPVNTEAIYTTQDIQLINGCFYRVIIAYKQSICTEHGKFLFWEDNSYENRKVAEVYEFYACTPEADAAQVNPNQTYNLGSAARVVNFNGYSGTAEMEKNDPHYGITLGQFFVSGYTDKLVGADGNMVFLKNVGDHVVLWFRLNQNIDAVGGNAKVSVTPDENGYDQYFQTTPTNFGRGTLIIRYTDYNNNTSEPQIYTNYLEANATVGADTMVSLFEEGDYEVALDYELTEDKTVDTVGHYRIFFRFSIRNGNCMVFPFDLVTGAELTNSAMTENGFLLDLARSRYLRINVKRELLADSADGLVEDTRFNGPARDGAEYRDEGIYTITATNLYTGAITVKRIYVGTNNILRAYMTTGLSIQDIKNYVAMGATIGEDGTIQMPVQTGIQTPDADSAEASVAPTVRPEGDAGQSPKLETGSRSNTPIVIVSVIAAAILVFVSTAVIKKKKASEICAERGVDSFEPEDTPEAATDSTEEPPAHEDRGEKTE